MVKQTGGNGGFHWHSFFHAGVDKSWCIDTLEKELFQPAFPILRYHTVGSPCVNFPPHMDMSDRTSVCRSLSKTMLWGGKK
jgi:hypothetical protein